MDKNSLEVIQELVGTVDALIKGVNTLCERTRTQTGDIIPDARSRLKKTKELLETISKNYQTPE